MIAPWLVAGCERNPFAPPPVTASFVTPEYFHLAVAGEDAAEAPGLRSAFFKEAEAFARANGCTGYRVMRELFQTSASVSPYVSTDPSLLFGRRPYYWGVVECRLAPIAGQDGPTVGEATIAAGRSTPTRAPTRLVP
jgi:hypothetical protein